MSLSLVNGAFGANGDNEWRQWMLHCRQWRFGEWRQSFAIGANGDIHWRHSLSPMAPNAPFTKLNDTFTEEFRPDLELFRVKIAINQWPTNTVFCIMLSLISDVPTYILILYLRVPVVKWIQSVSKLIVVQPYL